MNSCCQLPGHAKIIQSANPMVSWRVICAYCGDIIHVQLKDVNE